MPLTIPRWLEPRKVADQDFSLAYAAVADSRRALLKTCIARHLSWIETGDLQRVASRLDYRQGFTVFRRSSPAEGLILALAPGVRSPARLLASVLPAVAAGVEELAVVLPVDQPDREEPLLTALELAGCECVFRADTAARDRLFCETAAAGCDVRMVSMGESPEAMAADMQQLVSGGRVMLLPGLSLRVGLWWDEDDPLDIGAVFWAHPDLAIECWNGPAEGVPQSWIRREGTWKGCLDCRYDALYVPTGKVEGAASCAHLVLGPGHEGCWAWPGLQSDRFLIHRIGLSGSLPGGSRG
ncbi:MAG: hypothetical protein ACOCVU_00570 [Desulfohalobiaceae bacterium]